MFNKIKKVISTPFTAPYRNNNSIILPDPRLFNRYQDSTGVKHDNTIVIEDETGKNYYYVTDIDIKDINNEYLGQKFLAFNPQTILYRYLGKYIEEIKPTFFNRGDIKNYNDRVKIFENINLYHYHPSSRVTNSEIYEYQNGTNFREDLTLAYKFKLLKETTPDELEKDFVKENSSEVKPDVEPSAGGISDIVDTTGGKRRKTNRRKNKKSNKKSTRKNKKSCKNRRK
jgi:hypothetical protein